jgi:hypothetical protein
MIRKKFSVILCLLTFSLQLPSPLIACVENCRSQAQSCHREGKQEPSSQACHHSKASPRFAVEAKSGCDCAIQARQSPARETVFTLDFSRTEISKLSVADCDSSSKTVASLLEARLHSPPSFLGLTQQHTFLLKSNLRI